jgi:hypothetical protein
MIVWLKTAKKGQKLQKFRLTLLLALSILIYRRDEQLRQETEVGRINTFTSGRGKHGTFTLPSCPLVAAAVQSQSFLKFDRKSGECFVYSVKAKLRIF